MTARRVGCAVLVLATALAGTALVAPIAAPPAHAAFAGPDGKIAFSRETSPGSGIYHVFVMNPDGSGQTDLTPTETQGFTHPAWNADSTKLAFQDDTGFGVMNADGSGYQHVVDVYGEPAWSPVAINKIAYNTNQTGGACCSDIWTVNPDGTANTNITNNETANNNIDDLHPSWSPDGTKIAFLSYRGQTMPQSGIYVMNPDGSGQTQVLSEAYGFSEFEGAHLDWSPDGKKIVFVSEADGNGNGIDVVNADGTGRIHLADQADEPAWSPDGTKIAFRDRANSDDIVIMNPDGSGKVDVTNFNSAFSTFGLSWGSSGTSGSGGTTTTSTTTSTAGTATSTPSHTPPSNPGTVAPRKPDATTTTTAALKPRIATGVTLPRVGGGTTTTLAAIGSTVSSVLGTASNTAGGLLTEGSNAADFVTSTVHGLADGVLGTAYSCAPATTAPHGVDQNLITNDGAETGMDGWDNVTGDFGAQQYGSGTNLAQDAAPQGGGGRYFSGHTAGAGATWHVTFTDFAGLVDSDSVSYDLSGFLGAARAQVTFYDGSHAPLKVLAEDTLAGTTPPPGGVDPTVISDPGPGLIGQNAAGPVPRNAVTADIRIEGGDLDNVSFQLHIQCTQPNQNLLVNGDAEAQPHTGDPASQVPLTGWTTRYNMTSLLGGHGTASLAGGLEPARPPGPDGEVNGGEAVQVINLCRATLCPAGGYDLNALGFTDQPVPTNVALEYNLLGWFQATRGCAELSVKFLKADGTDAGGAASIGVSCSGNATTQRGAFRDSKSNPMPYGAATAIVTFEAACDSGSMGPNGPGAVHSTPSCPAPPRADDLALSITPAAAGFTSSGSGSASPGSLLVKVHTIYGQFDKTQPAVVGPRNILAVDDGTQQHDYQTPVIGQPAIDVQITPLTSDLTEFQIEIDKDPAWTNPLSLLAEIETSPDSCGASAHYGYDARSDYAPDWLSHNDPSTNGYLDRSAPGKFITVATLTSSGPSGCNPPANSLRSSGVSLGVTLDQPMANGLTVVGGTVNSDNTEDAGRALIIPAPASFDASIMQAHSGSPRAWPDGCAVAGTSSGSETALDCRDVQLHSDSPFSLGATVQEWKSASCSGCDGTQIDAHLFALSSGTLEFQSSSGTKTDSNLQRELRLVRPSGSGYATPNEAGAVISTVASSQATKNEALTLRDFPPAMTALFDSATKFSFSAPGGIGQVAFEKDGDSTLPDPLPTASDHAIVLAASPSTLQTAKTSSYVLIHHLQSAALDFTPDGDGSPHTSVKTNVTTAEPIDVSVDRPDLNVRAHVTNLPTQVAVTYDGSNGTSFHNDLPGSQHPVVEAWLHKPVAGDGWVTTLDPAASDPYNACPKHLSTMYVKVNVPNDVEIPNGSCGAAPQTGRDGATYDTASGGLTISGLGASDVTVDQSDGLDWQGEKPPTRPGCGTTSYHSSGSVPHALGKNGNDPADATTSTAAPVSSACTTPPAYNLMWVRPSETYIHLIKVDSVSMSSNKECHPLSDARPCYHDDSTIDLNGGGGNKLVVDQVTDPETGTQDTQAASTTTLDSLAGDTKIQQVQQTHVDGWWKLCENDSCSGNPFHRTAVFKDTTISHSGSGSPATSLTMHTTGGSSPHQDVAFNAAQTNEPTLPPTLEVCQQGLPFDHDEQPPITSCGVSAVGNSTVPSQDKDQSAFRISGQDHNGRRWRVHFTVDECDWADPTAPDKNCASPETDSVFTSVDLVASWLEIVQADTQSPAQDESGCDESVDGDPNPCRNYLMINTVPTRSDSEQQVWGTLFTGSFNEGGKGSDHSANKFSLGTADSPSSFRWRTTTFRKELPNPTDVEHWGTGNCGADMYLSHNGIHVTGSELLGICS